MRSAASVGALLLTGSLLAGCAGDGSRPAIAEAPPPLVPLSRFFAAREANWGYRVSPDGTRVAWITSHRGRTTVFFKRLDEGGTGIIDTRSPRSIYGFVWGPRQPPRPLRPRS